MEGENEGVVNSVVCAGGVFCGVNGRIVVNIERSWRKCDEVRGGLIYIGDVRVEYEGYMVDVKIVGYKGDVLSYWGLFGVSGERVRRKVKS